MPTQGSWRPLVTMSVASPSRVTVSTGVRMDDVGLNATRTNTGCPVEIPPAIPPALFARNSGWFDPSVAGRIRSAFSSPRKRAAPKPAPISTPFTALMLIIADASSLSSFAYKGAPQPGGTPVATHSITAPSEEPDLRASSTIFSQRPAAASSGQKKGFLAICDASKLSRLIASPPISAT